MRSPASKTFTLIGTRSPGAGEKITCCVKSFQTFVPSLSWQYSVFDVQHMAQKRTFPHHDHTQPQLSLRLSPPARHLGCMSPHRCFSTSLLHRPRHHLAAGCQKQLGPRCPKRKRVFVLSAFLMFVPSLSWQNDHFYI